MANRWRWLVAGLALASCGGRALLEPSDSSAGVGGGAQVTPKGGAGPAPGSGGLGANSAGTTFGGAPSTLDAGTPACDAECPELTCPPAEIPAFLGGVCCPVCRACLAADLMGCPSYDCGPSAHTEVAPGQCCPACVPNDAPACAAQTQTYAAGRAALAMKYATPCVMDSDCGSAIISNPCEQSCLYGTAALVGAHATDLNLLGRACTACPLPPPPIDVCYAAILCRQGECVADNLLK